MDQSLLTVLPQERGVAVSRFVVIEKHDNGTEMHVLRPGSMSYYGSPKKFLTREQALEEARTWAQVNANCRLKNRKILVREV